MHDGRNTFENFIDLIEFNWAVYTFWVLLLDLNKVFLIWGKKQHSWLHFFKLFMEMFVLDQEFIFGSLGQEMFFFDPVWPLTYVLLTYDEWYPHQPVVPYLLAPTTSWDFHRNEWRISASWKCHITKKAIPYCYIKPGDFYFTRTLKTNDRLIFEETELSLNRSIFQSLR